MRLLKNLFKNEFFRNVTTVLSGSVVGQAVVFLILPVLTRLYSQEVFGVYFIFISTFNILNKFSTLRFELAVVLSKNDKIAINAFAVTFVILLLMTAVVFLLSYVSSLFFVKIKGIDIRQFFIFIPIVIFFAGFYELLAAWNNRQKHYKKISASKISNSSAIGVFQIVSKKANEANGLILGFTLGKIFSALFIFFISIKEIFSLTKYMRLSIMKMTLSKYKKIPLFNTLINVLSNLSNEIPVYALGAFFGTSSAGMYGMANKIAASPVDIVGRSVSQVFYQKASDKYNQKDNLNFLFRNTIKNMFKYGAILILFIGILSPFVTFFIGQKWFGIAVYILILLPNIYLGFVVQSLSTLPTIFSRQDSFAYFLIVSLILKFLALYSGYLFFNNVFVALILFSAVSFFLRLYLLYWFRRLVSSE